MSLEQSRRAELEVVAAVGLGALLAPLNSTMIAVALPRVMADFDVGIGSAGWLVTGYLIALAALQPATGKLGDRLGRRPLILGGLAAFGLASVGAALAPSLPVLIAFRILQAVAGAVVFPNGVGLVREVVPAGRRAAAYGLVGGVIGVAAALGPPLGGLLVDAGGWRAIFYVNAPFVAAALALARRALPRGRAARPERPFDLAGALLACVLLGGLALLLLRGRGSLAVLLPGLAAVLVGGAAFLARESRHPDPVLAPSLFRRLPFAAASGAVALGNLAMYVTLLATPLLLARRAGWTSLETGLALAALSAPMTLATPLGGRLADRLGRRAPAVAGHALLALALLPLAFGSGRQTGPLLVCLALAGTGLGLATASLQTAAVEAVPPAEAGVAAGIFSTSRYLGSIAGSILLAILLAGTTARFGTIYAVCAACAAGAALASLGLPTRERLVAAAAPQPSK